MKCRVLIEAEVEAHDLAMAISALYTIINPQGFYSSNVKLPLRIIRAEEMPAQANGTGTISNEKTA